MFEQYDSHGDSKWGDSQRYCGEGCSRNNPFVFFADDCLLFCKANSLEANTMKTILEEFSHASQQHINFNKSSLLFSKNVDSLSRKVVSEIMGISVGHYSGKYLGLPSLMGRGKNQILGFIKQKILGRIKSWNSNFLSKPGMEVMINNVLHAIPTFAMSIFLLPVGLCKSIEAAMNKFWWKGEIENGRGIIWKRWQDLCKPKVFGGMGFSRIREFNTTLLGKQAWRFIHYPESLVSRVFKAPMKSCYKALNNALPVEDSMKWTAT
ncbi:uncharacterized protein LOC116013606 [Ipomoea triloba]|uniref:uncharacterized protein LOC116013606 n=1 Tax=Ipomoea triloba TaxID=35885 RepID=UPI00125E26D3|nr:uncharacterized protein LOC116013606 [Ipomoea triloba]